jgi:hypothetical protein
MLGKDRSEERKEKASGHIGYREMEKRLTPENSGGTGRWDRAELTERNSVHIENDLPSEHRPNKKWGKRNPKGSATPL